MELCAGEGVRQGEQRPLQRASGSRIQERWGLALDGAGCRGRGRAKRQMEGSRQDRVWHPQPAQQICAIPQGGRGEEAAGIRGRDLGRQAGQRQRGTGNCCLINKHRATSRKSI